MQFDAKVHSDDSQQGRDLRARAEPVRARSDAGAPGTPTEPTVAGGPEPTTRGEHQPPREQSERAADRERELAEAQRAAVRREQARRELARRLRLPGDTVLDIEVDEREQQVRFLVRDRDTGEVVRTIPPEEAASLAATLADAVADARPDVPREFRGAFVDRSL